MPADLAELAERYPRWRFGAVWAGAASGPDRRRVTAMKDGVVLSAWTPTQLAEQIRREETGQ